MSTFGQYLNKPKQPADNIAFVRPSSARRAAAAAAAVVDERSSLLPERTPQQQQQQMQQRVEPGSVQALDASSAELAERRRRLAEIHKLAQDVETVNALFVDMQMLGVQQGELIDNIELHIESTHHTVQAANEQLRGAARTQKRNRGLIAGITTTLLSAAAVATALAVLKPKIF